MIVLTQDKIDVNVQRYLAEGRHMRTGETGVQFLSRIIGDNVVLQPGSVATSPAGSVSVSVPSSQPGIDLSDLAPGDDPGLSLLGVQVPAGMSSVLAALGLSALAAPLVGAYGVSQAIGVQYPWETGPGEGFIAPWSRDIVQDEGGKWVTRETRPDLFPGNGAAPAMAMTVGAVAPGLFVTKTWTTAVRTKDGQLVETPFAMLSNGSIVVRRADGSFKKYRPKKHIILPRGSTTLSQAVKAQSYLDKLWRKVAKRTKAVKMA